MQIWDTAGQERFKNITQTYYKGAAGIILSYSITDATSFTNIERWMTQIESNAPENVTKILVATKNDLEGERSVSIEEGEELAKKHGIKFLEVSAKSGYKVKDCFESLGEEIIQKYDDDDDAPWAFKTNKNERLDRARINDHKNCSC